MPDEIRIPITAKIPESLHIALMEAVKTNRFKDKTTCITEALEKLLNNTQQETEDNTIVLQEKAIEIQNLQSELRSKYAEIHELQTVLQTQEIEIQKLQSVIRDAPDHIELAKLHERNEGLNLLIEEKEKRILELTQYKEDLGAFANYFKSTPPKMIETSEPKKQWWKFW
jgi:Arc/MetJ-type ribon-helix-helix transcriptional regulator